ncbi:conserved unknown protein [Ectocarpus siliculosus]|uniref:Uncharacterized protein n=1 Tax=Ectocarpus siliculosus TaxID=2880 RepID=D7G7V3_ECTSI|nr:conserved unknown protein [Ectocarpus siliculosus]|eukprot:CBJ27834.1 conserved unknown protein [Ectocarpus siliculosus]
MRYDARWLTGTACLVASPRAFRPLSQPCCFRRYLNGDKWSISSTSCSSTGNVGRERLQPLQRAASMLGMDAGLGVAGLSALSAVRLFTASITPKRVRVVTDIDDTVKSSGNKRLFGVPLGGIDAQYRRGVFYPGVFQFSLELSRYRVPSWQEPLSVAVLTARAREFLFALEIGDTHEITREFRQCGERNGIKKWGRGPVLYGSVKEWVCPSRKSERKARNFGFLLEDDEKGGRGRPSGAEGGYIFIGDTGEGDPRAGEIMSAEHPDRMRAVFLHVVSDGPQQGKVPVPMDRVVNAVPVVYFRTYVGAAVKAVELGLMDKKGLENVITAAKEAMTKVPRQSSKWEDINRDLMMAQTSETQLPSIGVKTLTSALDDALGSKINTKRNGAVRRRPPVTTAATKKRPH